MKKLRVGVIGVGNISKHHINGYIKNPNVELCAFCDINKEQLEKMGKTYNVDHLYTDVDEMLAKENLDGVSVCTWNIAHSTSAIKALNAGVHVFTEKPMAINLEEAKKMKEAADKNGKLLMVGFVCRHDRDSKVVKEFADKNYFGDFYYVRTEYLRRNGNPGGWFANKELSGGGPVIDLGVHFIDLARYIMGNPKPVSVYAVTYEKLKDRSNIKGSRSYTSVGKTEKDVCTVEDLASALIKFDNGATLKVEVSFALNIKQDSCTLDLYGTKGGVKMYPELEMYTEVNDYLADVKLPDVKPYEFSEAFEAEIDHFVDCILNGTKCMAPAEDGIEIMKILDGIYKSAEIGKEVLI